MKEFLKQKKTIENQAKTIENLKTGRDETIKKYKKKAEELHKYLVKMFKEVVNPLKSEVFIKDEMI